MNRSTYIWILVGLTILTTNMSLSAQSKSLSNQYSKELVVKDSLLLLDSLTVVPGSVSISLAGVGISSQDYYIQNNNIIFNKHIISELNNKKVLISYRVFDMNIEKVYQKLSNSVMDNIEDRIIYIGHDLSPTARNSRSKLIQSDDLNYDGSFTRGFSVGNSQSLVLNSNFNLQMSGDLGDGMSIEAAISDDNLSIQADGNTQLLQEFDKVFMRINKNNTSIIAGDYESGRPKSYFMNYFKKLKGLSVQNTEMINDGFTISSRGNYAIARGKFSRYNLMTQEGNQGPYRLVGSEGERLVKVLSGTEKIYLDGRLLTRGLDHDYIISYDRAELNFTPQILITKDSRIIVEFEYADQNYLRTQYGAGVDIHNEKMNFSINFYNEQDSKTATGDIDLDSLDLAILTGAGDNFDEAFRSGITNFANEELEFDPILYKLAWEPSISDSILVYTPNPDSALYRANFSEVGIGNGSYEIDNQAAANGRAYKWVGPSNGRYDPIIRLVAPEKKQLVTLGGKYFLAENTFVRGELALSTLDLNRFSEVNNGDNEGLAGTLGFEHSANIGKEENELRLISSGGIEIVDNNFNPLNPYRNAEFSRDWNLDTLGQRTERISQASVGLKKGDDASISYTLQNFKRQELYNGTKNILALGLDKAGWEIDGIANFLKTKSINEETSFARPIIDISKKFALLDDWTIGMHYEQENNQRTLTNEQNLRDRSFKYEYTKTYIQSPQYDKFNFRIGYNQRKDFAPQGSKFAQNTLAKEFEVSGNWIQGDHGRLVGNFVVRDLSIVDADLTQVTPKKTYLGRVDYDFNILNKAIRSNTSFQVGSGQQAKAEFEYIMVQKGQGQYIWLDDGDGVQETFEFQIAPVQDTANFVKLAIYNNEFVRTNDNSINQNLRFDGRNLYDLEERREGGYKKFISKISTLSNIRINKKSQDESGEGGFNPFNFTLQDTSLINYNAAINNTLFFNRGNPTFDFQIGNRKNTSRFVQVSGAEQNQLNENFTRIRWGANRATDILLNIASGDRSYTYDLFEDNSYGFDFIRINPEVNFRPKKNIRLIVDYIFQDRESWKGEKAKSNEFSGEITWRQASKTNLTASLGFVNVEYDGEVNTNLELAILDGLKQGQNYLWNLGLTRRMANNIDLIISYDGRKTGLSRTIHTGRAQVKATF